MMTEWLPKAPLDFHAALGDTTPLAAYARLDCPTLILCGQYAMTPSRLIAEALATTMPRARLAVIPNAGHMGPLTHADRVNGLLKQHLLTVAAEAGVFVEAA
jgi:pimeloyl-ACP methyl ester carboxylesterase